REFIALTPSRVMAKTSSNNRAVPATTRLLSGGRSAGPGVRSGRAGSANFLHVRSLQALGSLHDVELDFLALGERPEARRLDRGEVHEHILAALLGDETEPLAIIEPLHGTLGHCGPSCCGGGQT